MNQEELPKIAIRDFLNSILQLLGFRRGDDFKAFNNHLFIIKHPNRGKVLSTLKEYYPEYNFYWDNPRVLRWF